MANTLTKNLEFKVKLKEKFAFLKNKNSLFYFVLTLIGIGLAFFGYALITQKFTTPFSGDFSQQSYQLYYDFYDDWWTFFKTGQFPFYDANTFIGADNVFANTYYGLFSPFTFPILFVSRDFVPHMMALISIARLVVGGVFFRLYLKYLGCSEKTARLFSIAYAFMGWMAYYLWFNPFYEVMTFTPLILLGIERVIKERKILVVALGFFFLGISNYFFLLTMGVFGVCYAGFRYFQTIKTRNAKENWLVILYGFLGFLFGIGMSMFCVFPAVLASFSINRASNSKYLSTLIESIQNGDIEAVLKQIFTYWSANVTNYNNDPSNYYFSFAFPLASYFYPPISDRFTNIMHYKYFENTGSSIFIYTPNMILLGCAIYRSFKEKKVSHFIAMIILIACLFIPFFYFLCGAFVTAYGRWELVVPIAAITYIATNFDHRDEIPSKVVLVSGVITFLCMVGTYFLGSFVTTYYSNFDEIGDIIWIVLYELALCAIETGLFTKFWKKISLTTFIKVFLICEIIVTGTLVANIHSLQSISTSVGGGYNNIPTETKIMKEINDSDSSYFRVQSSRAYEGNTNIGMLENFNGVSTFHTFYNNDVDDFLRFSQIMMNDTAWNGTAFTKRTNLDEFLGVKYYISKDSDTTFTYTNDDGSKRKVTFDPNIPLGYERIDDENDDDGYRVYKNKYQINLGTSYDTIYFKNDCEGSIYNSFYPYYSGYKFVIRNEETYFKGVILDNEDVYDVMHSNYDDFNFMETAPTTTEAIKYNQKFVNMYANKDGKYFDPLNPDRDIKDECIVSSTENTKTNIIQLVFEPKNGDKYYPLGEEGSYYMFNYPVRQSSGTNYAATVYLIGEDENGNSKVITFDNGRNSSRSSSYSIRGLYSKEKVKRIIVCVDGEAYRTSGIDFYYEPFENCIARYQKAIDNGLTDVTYNVNTFTFKTNYEKSRFVVTQLAYTGGWKVYATDSSGVKTELKVYNSMGGFAGFVAPKGTQNYVMTYETPNFKTGLIISFISLFGLVSVASISLVISKRKKENTTN